MNIVENISKKPREKSQGSDYCKPILKEKHYHFFTKSKQSRNR